MEVDYISGPKTDRIFGMFKYQMEIRKRIHSVDYNDIEYQSLVRIIEHGYNRLFSTRTAGETRAGSGFNFNRNFTNCRALKKFVDISWMMTSYVDRQRYLQIVKNRSKDNNVKHIPYQELAYLLKAIEIKNVIVTVHDLIPWVYYNDRSWMWKNNIAGLKKASQIITISEFSKNEIIQAIDFPPDKIHVINDAVDHSIYYKQRDKRILNAIKIPKEYNIILYVGTEEPRQNFSTILTALAKLKKRMPHVKLLKIGDPYSFGARENNLALIDELGLKNNVFFVGYVSEEELPKWYNAADLLVYPTSYAGFGLPPLEAMACGTPVITSNTTSLPEVVGNASIMIEPTNVDLLADKMFEILNNEDLREELSNRGLKRSKLFSWDDSADKTLKLYEEVYHGI